MPGPTGELVDQLLTRRRRDRPGDAPNDRLPEPLRDRLEIVRVPGYLEPEKLTIAERFLVPRQLRECGLDPAQVSLADGVLPAIVRGWTREAGVRDLERRVGRVARKLARRRAETLTAEREAPPPKRRRASTPPAAPRR